MKVIVVGGGPAGMMSAISSAEEGNKVILIEKNKSLGKKLLITGKGRCNITSSLDIDEFIKNIPGNGKFLYSSFKNYTNVDIINFLKKQGLEVKEERGNRYFPVTDKSLDVLNCFKKRLKELNVEIYYEETVSELLTENFEIKLDKEKLSKDYSESNKTDKEKFLNVYSESKKYNKENNIKVIGVKTNKHEFFADKVIIATGGKSYPLTGSTGDGYKLAKNVGHTIKQIKPSLIPFVCNEKDICQELQGLSLKNAGIFIEDILKNKKIYDDFGEMLFTHFGVSGPVILSASAHLVRYKNIDELLKDNKIVLHIDLKPALSKEKLDDRVIRDFEEFKNKQFKNSLEKLLPQKMIEPIIQLSGIKPEKPVNEITKLEREKLVNLLKDFKLTIKGFRPIDEAIITSGGVSIKEINPSTMESKIVKNLYFAGEVIDVDAYTGGFNLQIAYSTGFTAGKNN